tara:strand:+ start:460 stop:750 length:291 start_codon:yes stop_codon:yes gene_type:complete
LYITSKVISSTRYYVYKVVRRPKFPIQIYIKNHLITLVPYYIDTFIDLRPVAGKEVGYEDMYNKLVTACDQIKVEEDGNFGMAVYFIFTNLPGESI